MKEIERIVAEENSIGKVSPKIITSKHTTIQPKLKMAYLFKDSFMIL